ncbi:Metal tolerance protein 2 [Acorus calamus]|uniref:Metal tolerance protein 2 n=1 Tax=Acorus calamus TaxID=4465 RepID=A0AAV9ETI4_ACOCL|nr:Metal tolerance protein 2 [Acorus calamus]
MGFRFFRRAYGLSRLASSTPPYVPNPFECVFVDPLSLRPTEQQQHHIQKMMNNHSHITQRWHGGHHHHEHTREGESVFRLGLAADVALAAGKAVTGYLSGSTAIIADAAHSVTDIITNRFEIQMSVEHMVHHSLQGKIMLQVQVSMPPDMWIRDAMDIAKEAEQEILKAAANINQVSIQLRLGHPNPQLSPGETEQGRQD